MKNYLYLALLAIVVVDCGQSHEKKAEALIKEELKKTLYKPETYKPVDTKVDSAFAPYDDPALFEEIMEFRNLSEEHVFLESKAKSAKSSMSLWSGPYQTEYGRNNYRDAKEEFDEANSQLEKLKLRGIKLQEKILSKLNADRKFIGYKVVHNYRADNNAGNTLIGNSMFFIDKDFKEVLFRLDVEEYNEFQEAIKYFVEQFEEMGK